MKIIHTVAVASLLGTLALANPLADAAKSFGIEAIPESNAELMKIIVEDGTGHQQHNQNRDRKCENLQKSAHLALVEETCFSVLTIDRNM